MIALTFTNLCVYVPLCMRESTHAFVCMHMHLCAQGQAMVHMWRLEEKHLEVISFLTSRFLGMNSFHVWKQEHLLSKASHLSISILN